MEITSFSIVTVLIAVVAVITLYRTARVVPQQQVFVVERLGRYRTSLQAGFHILVPFLDRVAYKHSLKERAIDVPQQVCITRDNVQIAVDGVLYLQVVDARRASYGIGDYGFAIAQLAQTTLRSEVGKIDLDRTFEERAAINASVVQEVDRASDPWGVKVLRYEIRDIAPPRDVLAAMEKQMRAEREKRATILDSEADRESQINRAEGEKQRVIRESEAQRQKQINEAEGRGPCHPRRRRGHRRGNPQGGRRHLRARRARIRPHPRGRTVRVRIWQPRPDQQHHHPPLQPRRRVRFCRHRDGSHQGRGHPGSKTVGEGTAGLQTGTRPAGPLSRMAHRLGTPVSRPAPAALRAAEGRIAVCLCGTPYGKFPSVQVDAEERNHRADRRRDAQAPSAQPSQVALWQTVVRSKQMAPGLSIAVTHHWRFGVCPNTGVGGARRDRYVFVS